MNSIFFTKYEKIDIYTLLAVRKQYPNFCSYDFVLIPGGYYYDYIFIAVDVLRVHIS